MSTSPITTHVLDTSRGSPATGLTITLSAREPDDTYRELSSGATDSDGRITDLLEPGTFAAGHYRMTFHTAAYFKDSGTAAFYPIVHVDFEISDTDQHYHIPLLLSPYGYSTYRGS